MVKAVAYQRIGKQAILTRKSKRKVLTMRFFGRVALLSALATVSGMVAIAQKPEETAPTRGAILVNLQQPVYPPLARQANIYGEVIVTVTVHPDGKAGVALESGHPMLAQAALDSAKQSQFECRGCESAVPYQLVYSFRLTRGGDCCSAFSVTPQVTQEPQSGEQNGPRQTHIAITAEAICLCDPAAHLTKRSRSVPDEATAVRIAERALAKVYGQKKIEAERPFKAMLRDGIWHVGGTLYCRDEKGNVDTRPCVGGVAMAEVRQRDGRVLKTTHTK